MELSQIEWVLEGFFGEAVGKWREMRSPHSRFDAARFLCASERAGCFRPGHMTLCIHSESNGCKSADAGVARCMLDGRRRFCSWAGAGGYYAAVPRLQQLGHHGHDRRGDAYDNQDERRVREARHATIVALCAQPLCPASSLLRARLACRAASLFTALSQRAWNHRWRRRAHDSPCPGRATSG